MYLSLMVYIGVNWSAVFSSVYWGLLMFNVCSGVSVFISVQWLVCLLPGDVESRLYDEVEA